MGNDWRIERCRYTLVLDNIIVVVLCTWLPVLSHLGRVALDSLLYVERRICRED